MRSVVVVSFLMAGCIRSDTTTCADGTLCRDGTVCAPAGGRTLCVTPQQLADCEGHAALDACSGGRCYAIDDGAVCLAIGCGNGFVDADAPELETCDDGNTASLDGCSADCRSDETCGNGVVDPAYGERCDDRNLVSHDGCSSRCDIEAPAWTGDEEVFESVGFVSWPMIAYDARRGRVVQFGGSVPGPQSSTLFPTTTFEWDAVWTPLSPPTVPPGRSDAAFAYDDTRGVTVLFGGSNGQGLRADVWEWTGADWRFVDAIGPAPRADAALVADPVHARMVLFGGEGDKTYNDTWELRAGVWTRLIANNEPGSPAASGRSHMTFDPVRGVVVLVSEGVQWELDGATWTRLGDVPARVDAPMWIVVEPATGQRLLLGQDTTFDLVTWAWTGQTWTVQPRATIMASTVSGVVADRVHGGVIAVARGAVARWDASGVLTQTALAPSVAPTAKYGAAGATDLRRRRTIVFAGNNGTTSSPTLHDQMFAFDGLAWTELAPAKRPAARWGHAMAYDPVRDQIVLFGGATEGNLLSAETWLWDGTAWTDVQPAVSPPARMGHGMAFDRERGQVVVFGGFGAGQLPRNDTWAWDGTTWTPISSSALPPARGGAALAADPVGGGLILFGGGEGEIAIGFDDTWRLTATGWQELDPLIKPVARHLVSLGWNAARRRLFLVGGVTADDSGIVLRPAMLDDAWEWDGAQWRPVIATRRATASHVALAAPDGRGVLVVAGRTTISDVASLTAPLHSWTDGGADETCTTRADADGDRRAGCADPDCWGTCTPLCGPGETSCPTSAPACGDGTCSALEQVWVCPADCGAAPTLCGDLVCDPGEQCPGDCP